MMASLLALYWALRLTVRVHIDIDLSEELMLRRGASCYSNASAVSFQFHSSPCVRFDSA